MEKRTQNVIARLIQLNSINEALNLVHAEHAEIKSKMKAYGVRFYDDEAPVYQDIRAGQQFENEDEILNSRFYQEINYIRVGLTKHWVYNIFEPVRFNKIRISVQAIVDIYKLDWRKKNQALSSV